MAHTLAGAQKDTAGAAIDSEWLPVSTRFLLVGEDGYLTGEATSVKLQLAAGTLAVQPRWRSTKVHSPLQRR